MIHVTRNRRVVSATIAFVSALAVAGCTFSANFTVNADEVANEAARALQEQVGTETPPNIDCGSEPFDLVENEPRVCDLTVDGDDNVYDATIVFTEVDGTSYRLEVEVGQEPR